MRIQEDRAERPDLFQFSIPISADRLNVWLRDKGLTLPNDLRSLWCEVGAGDMFESETILSPFGTASMADDIDSVNAFHRLKGMPADYLIFHIGLGGLSALKLRNGTYATLREGFYDVQQEFSSLREWYDNFIRKEYASRYGLK